MLIAIIDTLARIFMCGVAVGIIALIISIIVLCIGDANKWW